MADAGRWEEIVNELPVAPGHFFQVGPGTLHAILGATMVLETQQSSDVTYRVYDFDRRQADGTLRALHMRQALDVIDYGRSAPESGEVKSPEVDGVTELVRTPNCTVLRVRVTPEGPVTLGQAWNYLCMSVVKGNGRVTAGGESYALLLGSHLIVCSGVGELLLEGEMELICSHT